MHQSAPIIRHFDNLEIDASIRVLVRDDEPLFVAKDVCGNLDLGNTGQALASLDDDEKVTLTPSNVTTGDLRLPNRGLQFVTESGLYALIFKSRKEAARRFRKWVTSEVLPAIRREGRYDPEGQAARLDPTAAASFLLGEAARLADEADRLRGRAYAVAAVEGQIPVAAWFALRAEPVDGPRCGRVSRACRREAALRGIPIGLAKHYQHDGRHRRLCRPAATFPPALIAEVAPHTA